MAGGSLSETPDSSTVHSSTRHDTIFINHLSFLSVARVWNGPRLLTSFHDYSDSIQIPSQSLWRNLLAVKLSFFNKFWAPIYQFWQHNSTTFTHTSLGITNFTSVIMRTALVWVISRRVVVISYRSFGTTYQSQLQGSRIQCVHS